MNEIKKDDLVNCKKKMQEEKDESHSENLNEVPVYLNEDWD